MWLIFYLLVAVTISVAFWYQTKYRRRNKLLAKIPAIKSYPLIGSNLSFFGKSAADIFKILQKASADLGSMFRFDFSPFQSTIFVSDPKVIEGLLSSQKLIDKSVEYDFVRLWLNDG